VIRGPNHGSCEGGGYAAAINSTLRTVERRVRLYRNCVVSVSALATTVIMTTVVTTQWRWLALLLALMPLIGTYIALDMSVVAGWREAVLRQWAEGDILLGPLEQALRAKPSVPKITLDSMLDRLFARDLPTTSQPRDDCDSDQRRTLLAEALARDRAERSSVSTRTLVAAMISVGAVGAAFVRWGGL
jgi:hypothetical protein